MISLKTVRVDPVAEDRPWKIFEVAGGEFGGKLMVTRKAGRAVREALGEALEELPKGGVLYVDIRGVDLMDYSFADEALGILASRVANGEYGERHLVLVEEDRDLLENVEASLRQRSLAMIRVDEVGAEPALVGEIPDHLIETLQAIQERASITNADLAKTLGLNHTACNNRATRLAKLGLIHRHIETAAPGGRQYTYERIA
ncbi:MAG: winged helix-turn-helix domain-containing protein [Actinomycetota bacterium]|nr:winged helix-turn-helix domain-containing protein [Actinomycetota bacterium]